MDATKLIEEAGREIAHMKAEALSAANPYNENTIRLTLIIDLVAALKASEEQNKATTISLRCAEANLKAAIAETEPVKSANLAANKRIVELEQERDAARAELARLTTPRPIAEAPRDGTWILGVWLDIHASVPTAIRWVVDAWADESQENLKEPTHYLPLPEVKP